MKTAKARIKTGGRMTTAATIAWGLFHALPALAAAGGGKGSIDMTTTMLKSAGGLILIIGLILVAVWILRRFGGAGMNYRGAGSIIRILDTRMLSPRKYVTLVEIGSRTLALGVTEQNISVLAEMAKEELPTRNLPAAGGGFAEILKKFSPGGKD